MSIQTSKSLEQRHVRFSINDNEASRLEEITLSQLADMLAAKMMDKYGDELMVGVDISELAPQFNEKLLDMTVDNFVKEGCDE